MSTAEEMVDKFTVKESQLIKKLCDPLHRYLDVHYFWYSHTTADGGYFSIGSNPEMHEYYHAAKLYLHSPFFHNPKFIQPGFYSYRSILDPKFQETLDSCASTLNVNLGMSLVMKKGKELLRFGYASDTSKGAEFSERIINNLPLLKKFNAYFLSEIKPYLKSCKDTLVDLPEELGTAYNLAPKGLQKQTTNHDKLLFLDTLGLLKYKEVSRLAPRELDCLKGLYEGLNCREIGDMLVLSTRTVESYLEHAKLKLNADNKADLYHIAKLLHTIGYFE